MRTLTKHIIATLPLAVYMGCSLADSNTYHFNIPAQPLSSALSAVSQQTGLQPFYADAAVAGKQSPGLKGNYSKEQAVAILLADSGLSHSFTGSNTVAVKEKSSAEQSADTSANTLATMLVTDKAGSDDSNDPRNTDYKRTRSRTATKTDTPLMETPASVQVVPRAVMEDQKANTTKDALENVSGVRAQGTLGGNVGYLVRGFLTKNTYRNGLLQQVGNVDSLDAGNLESIEVLKGTPNLYGRSDVGGLVSLNTKRAIDTPYYSVEQRFGSYDMYRTQWDAGGAITKDKSLAYRFSGAYQTNNSFRDFNTADNMLFSPSIT